MNGYFIGNWPAINISVNNEIIRCIVDTGFTGTLMLSNKHIKAASLTKYSDTIIKLGDGREETVPTYICPFQWFEEPMVVEAIGVNSDENLLGMGMLSSTRLVVDLLEEVVEIKKKD